MPSSPAGAKCEILEEANSLTVKAVGNWSVSNIPQVDADLRKTERNASRLGVTIDLSDLSRMDSAGAWVLYRLEKAASSQGAKVAYVNARAEHERLLDRVRDAHCPEPTQRTHKNAFIDLVERIGESTIGFGRELLSTTAFLGSVIQTVVRTLVRPNHIRMTPTVYHMEKAGLDALPLVALLTFLVGAVLAQQGAIQLQAFGAEVYTVNLVTITFLREIGILLTAIIVAGRSGSAFTAEIGSMKMREELDAMRTLGLDPVELLIVPRALALMLTLPLLTFVADIMGLIGGAVVAFVMIDMTPGAYLESVRSSADLNTFLVGIVKAPFMALIISLIACRCGMRVEGSAESVGRQTTNSVVRSIFAVIVMDAIFAIIFSQLGI